jgi:hypothetical protein
MTNRIRKMNKSTERASNSNSVKRKKLSHNTINGSAFDLKVLFDTYFKKPQALLTAPSNNSFMKREKSSHTEDVNSDIPLNTPISSQNHHQPPTFHSVPSTTWLAGGADEVRSRHLMEVFN